MSTFTNSQLIGIGVAGVLGLMYLSKKTSEVATEVGHAVNPINQDNIFYSGVNAVGGHISGDPSWTLGGQIHEWFN